MYIMEQLEEKAAEAGLELEGDNNLYHVITPLGDCLPDAEGCEPYALRDIIDIYRAGQIEGARIVAKAAIFAEFLFFTANHESQSARAECIELMRTALLSAASKTGLNSEDILTLRMEIANHAQTACSM